MINSMTGFGTADGFVGQLNTTVEVRSVNHRFFTPNIKLPGVFAKWEGDVREILRKRVPRGYVTLFARTSADSAASAPLIDEERFAAYLAALRGLKDRHGIAGEIDVASVLRIPNVLAVRSDDEAPGSLEELGKVVASALDDMLRMRQSEGVHLQRYLDERLQVLKTILARIAKRAPIRLSEQHAKLKENVAHMLAGHSLDDQRVAQEIAILVEKLDVAEEIDRFDAHIAAFGETIHSKSGEPAGKRLGFLLQEMVRETNTLGSKANDSAILADVILLKEELERMREQIENVE